MKVAAPFHFIEANTAGRRIIHPQAANPAKPAAGWTPKRQW
jgi:hypothetical protein